MRLIKFSGLMLAVVFLFGVFVPVFAQDYTIDELGVSVSLPDTWQVTTRDSLSEDDAALKTMKRFNRYMTACVADDTELQHEITISAEASDESLDYNLAYRFELELTAKKSFEENPNANITYHSYDVKEGTNTKFLVFEYEGKDEEGTVYYGKFYHTVMNSMAVQFDMTAYGPLTEDYIGVFDNAVLGAEFSQSTTGNNERLKKNLTYLALIVLAVALVAAIVMFIISKIKEKKAFDRAAKEAIIASRTTPTNQSTGEETDEPGDCEEENSEE